jgi:hypothetical protein
VGSLCRRQFFPCACKGTERIANNRRPFNL